MHAEFSARGGQWSASLAACLSRPIGLSAHGVGPAAQALVRRFEIGGVACLAHSRAYRSSFSRASISHPSLPFRCIRSCCPQRRLGDFAGFLGTGRHGEPIDLERRQTILANDRAAAGFFPREHLLFAPVQSCGVPGCRKRAGYELRLAHLLRRKANRKKLRCGDATAGPSLNVQRQCHAGVALAIEGTGDRRNSASNSLRELGCVVPGFCKINVKCIHSTILPNWQTSVKHFLPIWLSSQPIRRTILPYGQIKPDQGMARASGLNP